MPDATPIIELRGVTKSFHGLVANHAVDFDVRPGEIHALLGENGAGKSTLMNIMAGIYRPDLGEIRVDGEPAHFASPLDAINAGVGMVHQHFKLVSAFTVAENIHLGWSDTPSGASSRVLERRTARFAEQFGIDVAPASRVRDLSAGERQRVEILRVLVRGARVLVMDEPTAVLTPAEVVRLMATLKDFRADGRSVVLISHKLGEVLGVADRITVMRAGRVEAVGPVGGFTAGALARAMVGRETATPRRTDDGTRRAAEPCIRLRGITLSGEAGPSALSDVDLDLHPGEILGIAGVAGNGQRELSEVLAGCRRPDAGTIAIEGRAVAMPTADFFADRGIGHIPEDRLRTAVAPGLGVAPNAALREYRREPIRRGLWLRSGRMKALADDIIASARVASAGPATPFRNLSGGNQQRIVVTRETRISRLALVATYPTRGLDVGAVHGLQQAMLDLRAEGVGIVLISEDLDEILSLSDRIAVLYKGRISKAFERSFVNLETIGLLMGGEEREARHA